MVAAAGRGGGQGRGEGAAGLGGVDDLVDDADGDRALHAARDLLVFGDATSPSAMAELERLCERTRGNVDYPISSKLHHRTASGWRPFDFQARPAPVTQQTA